MVEWNPIHIGVYVKADGTVRNATPTPVLIEDFVVWEYTEVKHQFQLTQPQYADVMEVTDSNWQINQAEIEDNIFITDIWYSNLQRQLVSLINNRKERVIIRCSFIDQTYEHTGISFLEIPLQGYTGQVIYDFRFDDKKIIQEIMQFNIQSNFTDSEWNDAYSFTLTQRLLNFLPIDFLPLQYIRTILSWSVFEDPNFPVNEFSLFGEKSKSKIQQSYCWKRARDLFRKDPSIFHQSIDKSDVNQGQVGNCWFMSILSAMAEQPQIIQQLFVSQEYDPKGVYRVNLNKHGEWETITLDDQIPCYTNGGPIFSKANGPELWVILLEKAYAKLHGAYLHLSGGYVKHAYVDLTGKPAFQYSYQDYTTVQGINAIWNKLLTASDKKHFLVTSTSRGINQDSTGIVGGHYYAILQVIDYDNNKLLKLRNPWGHFEWKGDWSDDSHLWNDEMRLILDQYGEKDDGEFWISWDDYLKYFASVSICINQSFVEQGFRLSIMKTQFGGQSQEFYDVFIEDAQKIYIGVFQEDTRIVGTKNLRPIIDTGIVILKLSDQGIFEFYACSSQLHYERDQFLEIDAEPGLYQVQIISGGLGMINKRQIQQVPIWSKNNILHPIMRNIIKDIFKTHARTHQDSLTPDELFIILEKIYPQHAIDTQFYFNRFANTEKGLTFYGLCDLFNRYFVTINNDDSTQLEFALESFLTLFGYDERGFGQSQRNLYVKFFSQCKISITRFPNEQELYLQAWNLFSQNSCLQPSMVFDHLYFYLNSHERGCSIIARNTSNYNYQIVTKINTHGTPCTKLHGEEETVTSILTANESIIITHMLLHSSGRYSTSYQATRI